MESTTEEDDYSAMMTEFVTSATAAFERTCPGDISVFKEEVIRTATNVFNVLREVEDAKGGLRMMQIFTSYKTMRDLMGDARENKVQWFRDAARDVLELVKRKEAVPPVEDVVKVKRQKSSNRAQDGKFTVNWSEAVEYEQSAKLFQSASDRRTLVKFVKESVASTERCSFGRRVNSKDWYVLVCVADCCVDRDEKRCFRFTTHDNEEPLVLFSANCHGTKDGEALPEEEKTGGDPSDGEEAADGTSSSPPKKRKRPKKKSPPSSPGATAAKAAAEAAAKEGDGEEEEDEEEEEEEEEAKDGEEDVAASSEKRRRRTPDSENSGETPLATTAPPPSNNKPANSVVAL